ncbi:MAG TPA: amidohydrolase family protein [Pseudonocardiaceae bacterium]
MTRTLLITGCRVHTPGGPAGAMAVADTVLWTGEVAEGRERFPGAVELSLDGATVTPAFVDSHVHATSAGLLLTGIDLKGCGSLAEFLDAVRRFAVSGEAPLLWGQGWDETRWPERRPPTRAELDEATGGRPAYLSRVDMHSALVTSQLAARATGEAGFHPDGPLSQQAHHVVRQAALDTLADAQRDAAQGAFLAHAAAHGIAAVHECAGPDISGVADLRALLDRAAAGGTPDVVGYWGQPVGDAGQATELLAATGASGLAGDLFCDGAVGSRTASLCAPYADAAHTTGAAYLDAAAIAAHVAACTEVGTQAGFHVIGDAAMAAVVEGVRLAGERLGKATVAACTHRLEHVEMITQEQARVLAAHGVMGSVQPLFDALWGGPDGMYAERLGAERAIAMNPFSMLAATGVALTFGSDVPVTPVGPWAAVRAAVRHRTPGSGLTPVDALRAHTAHGHLAARAGGVGELVAGQAATYAVWDGDGLDLDAPVPRCVATVVRGRAIHDDEGLLR